MFEWAYLRLIGERLVDSITGVEANPNWPSFTSHTDAEEYLRANDIRASVQ